MKPKKNEKTYYSFTFVFSSKERSFYCDSKEIYENFIEKLKEDFDYEMLDDLGEDIFGDVKLGVENKTKERVAIENIKKKKPNKVTLK